MLSVDGLAARDEILARLAQLEERVAALESFRIARTHAGAALIEREARWAREVDSAFRVRQRAAEAQNGFEAPVGT